MRSIHTSTLTIYQPRDKQREDISKGQRYQRNSRNHVRNTRDMNKNNTILYFCYWTSCYAVTSV